jgi:hypothetical protein
VQHALGRRLVRFEVTLTADQLADQLDRLAATVPLRVTAEPVSAHLVARCAAALACIVGARVRRPPSWSLLRAVTARDGHLVVTDDALRVVMSATAIDLEHRRAGLDQDPGRIPWLQRDLRLEFVGGDTA